MSEFDFEITGSFRARELIVHAPPDAALEAEGEEVKLERAESRTRLPAELRTSETYEDVALEKRVVGRLDM